MIKKKGIKCEGGTYVEKWEMLGHVVTHELRAIIRHSIDTIER